MEFQKKIQALENQIEQLPKGYISRKKISGKVKLYLQWSENGKKKSKYVDDKTAAVLAQKIEERKNLQQELKILKALHPKDSNPNVREESAAYPAFHTTLLTGEALRNFVNPVMHFRKRRCFSKLQTFLQDNAGEKILILYGLCRTGKTTLIRQAIGEMEPSDFSKSAFIQIRSGNTLSEINQDLKKLQKRGYRTIFIDEVTFMDDFIEGAALFSDIYAASGMKIILSGADSLGFLFSEDEQLYDRCIFLHTTWIPYREFEDVLSIQGIDEYIRFGGTMSLSGIHYHEHSTFASLKSTDAYVDSAIARNIQHSLKCYQHSGHFRSLQSLYEKNELTGAINRIVEDINHRFTLDVLTRNFISHDLRLSAANLRRDRENPTDILDRVEQETITKRLKEILEIKNKNEQTIPITDAHRREIEEYLNLLDLIVTIPVEQIPVSDEKIFQTVISQPGMRYAQVKALIEELLSDSVFQSISIQERTSMIERILNEVKGRMMEEIVLLETKMKNPKKKVFKLQFAVGEFDMVVADPEKLTCEIYEIKHSTKAVKAQYRHLVDQKKCEAAEFRYGKITRKSVIYRGPSGIFEGIDYQNVEEYL